MDRIRTVVVHAIVQAKDSQARVCAPIVSLKCASSCFALEGSTESILFFWQPSGSKTCGRLVL